MSTPETTLGYDDTSTRRFDAEDSETKTRPINLGPGGDTSSAARLDDEPSYIQQDAKADVNSRWQEVQTEFVDDPRKSVAHAHQLVSDAVQRIVDTFTEERNQLERQWSEGGDVSTEELRVCLQRYRAFFTRLLPLENAKSSV